MSFDKKTIEKERYEKEKIDRLKAVELAVQYMAGTGDSSDKLLETTKCIYNYIING